MNSPITWFGGKFTMRSKIIDLMPPHKTYVEVFGGAGHVLFGHKPEGIEVYNDLDEGLVNLFRVLSDPEQFDRFYRRVGPLPYSRAVFGQMKARLTEPQVITDPIEWAVAWFVVARQSFGGLAHHPTWGYVVASRNKALTWMSVIDHLPEVHERLRRVQVECLDFGKILSIYDRPETLFYCDPPYHPDTRSGAAYKHEMDHADHIRLIDNLLNLKGMAIVSGYDHPLYDRLTDAGWERKTFAARCMIPGRTRGCNGLGDKLKRTEVIWISPNAVRKQTE